MPLLSIPHSLKTEILSWPFPWFPSRAVVPLEYRCSAVDDAQHGRDQNRQWKEEATTSSFHWFIMPTSPDASFTLKFQDGGQIPEVVIMWRRKTISTWSQRLRQCFRAHPIHVHRNRHRTISRAILRRYNVYVSKLLVYYFRFVHGGVLRSRTVGFNSINKDKFFFSKWKL